jgi:hypothetical protein
MIYGLLNATVRNPGYTTLNDWMAVNNELERMWKKQSNHPVKISDVT